LIVNRGIGANCGIGDIGVVVVLVEPIEIVEGESRFAV